MDIATMRLAVALEKVDGIVMLPMQAHQKTVKPYSCIDLRLDALSKEERDDVLVKVAGNDMIYVRTTDDGEVLDFGLGVEGPDGLGFTAVLMKLDEVMKKVEKLDEGVEKLKKLDVEKPDDTEVVGGPDGLGVAEVLIKLDKVMEKVEKLDAGVEKLDEGVEKLKKLDVEKPDDSEARGFEARKYIIICVCLFAGGYALGRCGADVRCQFVTGNQAIKEFFTPAMKSGFEVFRKELGLQLLRKLSLS